MISRTLIFNRKQGQEMCIGLGMLGYILFAHFWTNQSRNAEIQQLVGFVLAQGWPTQDLERPRQISWLITSKFCHNKQRSLGSIDYECYLNVSERWKESPPINTLTITLKVVTSSDKPTENYPQLWGAFYCFGLMAHILTVLIHCSH